GFEEPGEGTLDEDEKGAYLAAPPFGGVAQSGVESVGPLGGQRVERGGVILGIVGRHGDERRVPGGDDPLVGAALLDDHLRDGGGVLQQGFEAAFAARRTVLGGKIVDGADPDEGAAVEPDGGALVLGRGRNGEQEKSE